MSLDEIRCMVEEDKTTLSWDRYNDKANEYLEEIRNISPDDRTYIQYFKAVSYDYKFLQEVPDRLIDAKLCSAALSYTNWRYNQKDKKNILIRAISLNVLTDEVCHAFLKHVDESSKLVLELFELIPDNMKTNDLYIAALKKYGDVIKIIPRSQRTTEMYREALKKDGDLIHIVPKGEITEEFIILSIREKSDNIRCIDKKYQTNSYYIKFMNYNPWIFKSIPDEFKSPEVCSIAIREHMADSIPRYMFTKELCRKLISIDPYNIYCIPQEYIDNSIRYKVVKTDGELISYIPKDMLDKYICRIALDNGAESYQIPNDILAELNAEDNYYYEPSDEVRITLKDFGKKE